MHRQITGRLVIATHNPGKLAEMRELLAPHGVEAISAGDLGLGEPEETGTTFRANAAIKAIAAAKASGLPAFADDSGLVVDALDGAPGIYSARWAGPAKDFDFAMNRVQTELKGKPDRGAKFVCALALAYPDGHCDVFEGEVHGTIVAARRGTQGFGYDPIFQADGHDLTFGSGSVDGIVGAEIYASYRRLFLTVAAQYKMTTEGSFEYQFANDLTWMGGAGYYLLLEHDATLSLAGVLSGETKGNDEQAGVHFDDTAITALYCGPAFDFTWGTSLTAEVAADLPVVQNNTGLQIVPDFRMRGALVWRF